MRNPSNKFENRHIQEFIERSRDEVLYITKLFTLALTLLMFFSCSEDKTPEPAKQETENADGRISKIEITEFGKTTNLKMSYEKDVINIEFQPYKGNVESRIELNDRNQIREIISGARRIQYLYDENGRLFGIFSDDGVQQIMFDYDDDNIVAQHTIHGNDTMVSFRYSYKDGLPSEVDIKGRFPYHRKYRLDYTDIDNQLSGFNEMVLPAETSGLLGIPAMYGKKYLKRAIRIDSGTVEYEPLSEEYTPNLEMIEFEITSSGKQEELKLVSDGTRQWSAKIFW